MEEDHSFVSFMRDRRITEAEITHILSEKITPEIISGMTDDDLSLYFAKHGDRLAVKQYSTNLFPCSAPEMEEMNRIREAVKSAQVGGVKKKKSYKPLLNEAPAPVVVVGSLGTVTLKTARLPGQTRIQLGWKTYVGTEYRQVRVTNGGGSRLSYFGGQETMSSILTEGIELFFPGGKSPVGFSTMFNFELQDFSGNVLADTWTVDFLVGKRKFHPVRVYVCSKLKTTLEDPSLGQLRHSGDSGDDFDDSGVITFKAKLPKRSTPRLSRKKKKSQLTASMSTEGTGEYSSMSHGTEEMKSVIESSLSSDSAEPEPSQ